MANVDFLNSGNFSSEDLPADRFWPLFNGMNGLLGFSLTEQAKLGLIVQAS